MSKPYVEIQDKRSKRAWFDWPWAWVLYNGTSPFHVEMNVCMTRKGAERGARRALARFVENQGKKSTTYRIEAP